MSNNKQRKKCFRRGYDFFSQPFSSVFHNLCVRCFGGKKKRRFKSVGIPRNSHLHILHSDQFTTDYVIIRCESPSCLKLGRAKTPSHSDLSVLGSAAWSAVRLPQSLSVWSSPVTVIRLSDSRWFTAALRLLHSFSSRGQHGLAHALKDPLSHKKWAGDGVYEPTRLLSVFSHVT